MELGLNSFLKLNLPLGILGSSVLRIYNKRWLLARYLGRSGLSASTGSHSEWPSWYLDMGVSKNSCTPKSSILIRFSIINHPFWGTPIFGNIHIMKPKFRSGFLLNLLLWCTPLKFNSTWHEKWAREKRALFFFGKRFRYFGSMFIFVGNTLFWQVVLRVY